MKYENLSKENFWDALYEKYPLGMNVFCDWVDKYKADNDWDILFNGGIIRVSHLVTKSPKYHELPMAFQIGMWMEFVEERGGCQWEIEDMLDIDWMEEITGFIQEINEQEKSAA